MLEKIRRGQQRLVAEGGLSQDEMERDLAKWISAPCHSERSEESSGTTLRISAPPEWILHFVQDDKQEHTQLYF